MRPLRIVLTGGPGAGKTTAMRHFTALRPRRWAAVPEAATQVYQMLGKRWDQLDPAGRRDLQRRIYRRQIDQEDRAARQFPGQHLLLDRGTVDGAAYWPEGPQDYWAAMATSYGAELRRYDAVIWLQTAAARGVYDGPASNPQRRECAAAAVELGQRVRELWSRHRCFHSVAAEERMEQKLAAIEHILARLAG